MITTFVFIKILSIASTPTIQMRNIPFELRFGIKKLYAVDGSQYFIKKKLYHYLVGFIKISKEKALT